MRCVRSVGGKRVACESVCMNEFKTKPKQERYRKTKKNEEMFSRAFSGGFGHVRGVSQEMYERMCE